jgi:uracil phosphoribosyltransferase
MLTVLNTESSIVNQYLQELRDIDLQKDRRHFEDNLERLGMVAGYELSKQLNYVDQTTTTPLGTINTPILKDQLVLSTILRAGLPVLHGVRKIFDTADIAFIAAGRKPNTDHGVEIDLAYVAGPDLTGKVLIMADTMLATGKSIVDAYNALVEKHGQPSQTFIVAVVSSQPGVDYVQEQLPDANLIVCTVDPELNDHYYIVPGLGDAGDLLYGPKQ